MTNLIGQSLGRYHILEQLGEGGMAVVYKAYDTTLERHVAVKIIRSNEFGSAALGRMLQRFKREARALAKLSHPNIVKVIDYGDQEGVPYLVMEYLPGGTLKKLIRGQPMPWQDAARLLLPVCSALSHAHEANIIHRDIKPTNILLTQSREPMLTDFGIAKILEGSETTADLTATGMGIGTPEYMAPEQWTGQTSPQSDLYSLGVILYEMVTGRKPYTAETPAAILLKQATEPLQRPSAFAHNLPKKVEEILIKALARDPKDRYKDMGEVAQEIDQLQVLQKALHNEEYTQDYFTETVRKVQFTDKVVTSHKNAELHHAKVVREKAEYEARERVLKAKIKREVAKKNKRESIERQSAQQAPLVKALADFRTALTPTLHKTKPGFKIFSIIVTVVMLLWLGSWGFTRLANLIPDPIIAATSTSTKQITTPSKVAELSQILSPTLGLISPTIPPPKTSTPSQTPTITLLPQDYAIVPEVIGLKYYDAVSLLTASGFQAEYSYVVRPGVDSGIIVGQTPEQGTGVKLNEVIKLDRTIFAQPLQANAPITFFLGPQEFSHFIFDFIEGNTYIIKASSSYSGSGRSELTIELLDLNLNSIDMLGSTDNPALSHSPTQTEYKVIRVRQCCLYIYISISVNLE